MRTSVTMKSILLIAPYPPPYGGVSSHTLDLIQSFNQVNQHCDILHFDDHVEKKMLSNHSTLFRVRNIPSFSLLVLFLQNFHKLIKFFYSVSFIRDIRLFFGSMSRALIIQKHLKDNSYSDVIIYTSKLGFLIPFLASTNKDIDIHYSFYADFSKNPSFYSQHRSWFKNIFDLVKTSFSSSKYCANLPSYLSKSIQPYVVYVGVDTERFRPVHADIKLDLRAKLSLDAKQTAIFVARFESEMGIESVLSMFEAIFNARSDLNLIICGASGSASSLIKDFESKHPQLVRVFENFESSILPELYQTSDILIAPTVGKHACMGVSVKEAMSSGLISFVSNSGGLPEAIRHCVDGFIIDLDDEGMVDENTFIASILRYLDSEDSFISYRDNARKRAIELFSSQATLKKYQDLLEL
jgi:glycosyltransferase involved in cell wall biosynthesis